ncbi:hypothetical protein [Niabella drilacis]|nr:hypothetical protein [Niabella drilacis]
MKKQLLTSCLLVIASCCFSQDRIVTLGKDTIDAIIIKSRQHAVVYRLPGDSSGHRYRMSKRQVRSIIKQTEAGDPPLKSFRERVHIRMLRPPFEEGSNLLAVGLKRFGMNDGITAAYISYERRFFFNRLSAVIAPQIALGGTLAGGAVGVRYTPAPHARVNFFIGNDLLIWREDQRYYNMERLPDKTYITRTVTQKVNRGGLLITTGCKINTGKNWVIIPAVGWGLPLWKGAAAVWKDGLSYQSERMLMETVWQAQLGVGYRF